MKAQCPGCKGVLEIKPGKGQPGQKAEVRCPRRLPSGRECGTRFRFTVPRGQTIARSHGTANSRAESKLLEKLEELEATLRSIQGESPTT